MGTVKAGSAPEGCFGGVEVVEERAARALLGDASVIDARRSSLVANIGVLGSGAVKRMRGESIQID